jgi:hypothetical protein
MVSVMKYYGPKGVFMNTKLMVLSFCLLSTLHMAVAMEQDRAEKGLISNSSENLGQLIDELESFGMPEYTRGTMNSDWKATPGVRDILVKNNKEIKQHGISQTDSNRLYRYRENLYDYRSDSYGELLRVYEPIAGISGLACLCCGLATPTCAVGASAAACATTAAVLVPVKMCCMATGAATLASTLCISCNHQSIGTGKNPGLESILNNVQQRMIYDASTKTPFK